MGKAQQKGNDKGPLIRWLEGRRGLTEEGYQAILDIVDTKTAAWYDELAEDLQRDLMRLTDYTLTVWTVDRWYDRCLQGYNEDMLCVRASRMLRNSLTVSMTQWLAIELYEKIPEYDLVLWLAGRFEQVVRERVNVSC